MTSPDLFPRSVARWIIKPTKPKKLRNMVLGEPK